MFDIKGYWAAVAAQDASAIRAYFAPGACIQWHNTNERFTLEEFIRANCEYPGSWQGAVERVEELPGLMISVSRVWTTDGSLSFHVASFIRLEDGKIRAVDEYWGDDGPAPQWRQDKHIGRAITAR